MTAQVIQIGDLALRRKESRYGFVKSGECKHLHLTMDDNGDTVQCEDCKVYVSAYWALKMLAAHFDREHRNIEAAKQRLDEATKERRALIATNRVDKVWRSRTMIPACPHCGAGIRPEDGLGNRQVSREWDEKRRARKTEVHHECSGFAAPQQENP